MVCTCLSVRPVQPVRGTVDSHSFVFNTPQVPLFGLLPATLLPAVCGPTGDLQLLHRWAEVLLDRMPPKHRPLRGDSSIESTLPLTAPFLDV